MFDQALFEIACTAIVVGTLVLRIRQARISDRSAPADSVTRTGRVLIEYLMLVTAGWLGEQSMIEAYRFYAYDGRWLLFVGHVPWLVPLIWPHVILSARDVIQTLASKRGLPAIQRAALVGLVVIVDASLVEVIAVKAGLWRWAESGYLSVPVIGVLGWGFFGAAASWMLDRPSARQRLLIVVVAPVAAHALVLVSWWALFRHAVRGGLPESTAYVVVIVSVIGSVFLVSGRRSGHFILPPTVWMPRVVAASIFFMMLVLVGDRFTLLHTIAVAIPYVAISGFRNPELATGGRHEPDVVG